MPHTIGYFSGGEFYCCICYSRIKALAKARYPDVDVPGEKVRSHKKHKLLSPLNCDGSDCFRCWEWDEKEGWKEVSHDS